jgi:hypothetical protein
VPRIEDRDEELTQTRNSSPICAQRSVGSLIEPTTASPPSRLAGGLTPTSFAG